MDTMYILEVQSELLNEELISSLMFDFDCLGIQTIGADIEAIDNYGEVSLASSNQSNEITIEGYFADMDSIHQCILVLNKNFNNLKTRYYKREVEDWNNSWKEQYEPIIINNDLKIIMPWMEYNYKSDIIINPSTGFGVGNHPTTKMCIEFLVNVINNDDVFIDIGAGSGILSLASSKIGAKRGYAIEVDPSAINNCKENISLNNVNNINVINSDSIDVISENVTIIICNIVPNIFIKMIPTFYQKLIAGGNLILSGIQNNEIDLVKTEVQDYFEIIEYKNEGIWNALLLKRK